MQRFERIIEDNKVIDGIIPAILSYTNTNTNTESHQMWSPGTILASPLDHSRTPLLAVNCDHRQLVPEPLLFLARDINVTICDVRFDGIAASAGPGHARHHPG